MVEEADDEAARMSPGRLEAFSDGVIAIAITLLSLEIRLPEDLSLLDGLSSLWPSYVGFVLSFLLIGQVWLNHHAIFQRIRYVDQWVLVWNLLLLLDVAFLSFATTVLTRALKTGGEARAGAVFYGLVMMFGGFFFNGLWQAAIRDRGCLRPGVPDAVVRAMTRRFAMGPILYAIAAAVSMVSAWLSVTTYLLLIVFYMLGGFRRRSGSREPRRTGHPIGRSIGRNSPAAVAQLRPPLGTRMSPVLCTPRMISMLILFCVAACVPIALAVMVPVVLRRAGVADERRWRWWLYAACAMFAVSWYLPSPLIDGQDTSFTTHFVGGGVFTGLLWYYLKRSLGWRGHWLIEAFSLFALVSALGCINELFELATVRAGLVRLSLTDTNWDILANSLGALVVYAGYLLGGWLGDRKRG